MRYMMFIKHTEDYRHADVPSGLYEAMDAFVAQGRKDGTFVDAGGLQPTSAAHRVQLRGGTITVTDGPFVESKEVIGGYAFIEAKSDAEALAIARRFMDLHRIHWPAFEGECEVRPLEGGAQEQK